MKAIIFLAILASAIAVVLWRVRKAQAEAAEVRRKAIERRKKKDAEMISQDTEVIWPVFVTPVTGKRPPGEEAPVEEPSMTAIEFEPAESKAAQQGGSN